MEKMELYNKLRAVPEEAQKTIGAGRLKGFTDINPMWRIKALTEAFGPCGLGWWYTIRDKRLERGLENEIRAFVDIDLYYKYNGEVSQPIPGTGGASFVTIERNGVYCSDECFKMALTDAISTAAKAIGVAADIYYSKDRSKYSAGEPAEQNQKPATQNAQPPRERPIAGICEVCGSGITDHVSKTGTVTPGHKVMEGSVQMFGKRMCGKCLLKANAKAVAEKAEAPAPHPADIEPQLDQTEMTA